MNRDPANLFWYWLQPGLGVLLAALSTYTIVMLFAANGEGIPSIPFGINGGFVYPGLLLSIGINQLILRKRVPRVVTLTERIMLGIIVGLVVVLIATSFDDEISFSALFIWPVLILVAIALTIVIVVKNTTLANPVVAPVVASTAYGAQPAYGPAVTPAQPQNGAVEQPPAQNPAEPTDPLDELFAGGKD